MPEPDWWPPWHHHERPCDCEPQPVTDTVTITDAAGNVRAVRDAQFLVRPHRHHGRREDDGE